jgi:hypothetical protein
MVCSNKTFYFYAASEMSGCLFRKALTAYCRVFLYFSHSSSSRKPHCSEVSW